MLFLQLQFRNFVQAFQLVTGSTPPSRVCGIAMSRSIDIITLCASPPRLAQNMKMRMMEQVISDIILTAEKEIFLSCYVFTYRRFASLLIDAMSRDVKVDVYIGNEEKQLRRSEPILRDLEKAGIRVHRLPHPNHTKVLVADRFSGLVGSANFSKAGMNTHIEIGLHIKGPTCENYVRQFTEGLAKSEVFDDS